MPALDEDRDRNVIPRWRRFHAAESVLDATPLHQHATPDTFSSETFDRLMAEWDRYRTFSYAADLLSCAVSIGKASEAKGAAEAILGDPRPGFVSLRTIARRVVGQSDDQDLAPEILDPQGVADYEGAKIRKLRLQAQRYPKNAFLWLDLALTYEILGVFDKADRAIRVALDLAPNNRIVLRSSSRFLIHRDRYDDAYALLRHAPPLKSDPWLMAAFLATARASRKPPRFVKTARRMLVPSTFAPRHVSELASAVGMLELSSGKRKVAEKFFNLSLQDPTENAIAQASWIARRSSAIAFASNDILTGLGPSHEALTWHFIANSRWDQSLTEAWQWLGDQPFSARPAIQGSYIAAHLLGRYDESARIARIGLLANPSDATLLNNCAFAAAQGGDTELAERVYRRLGLSEASIPTRIACTATKGLICFRTGRPTEGRHWYQQAIALARQNGDSDKQATAAGYFALEELRHGTPEAEVFRREAIEMAEQQNKPAMQPLIERLQTA